MLTNKDDGERRGQRDNDRGRDRVVDEEER